MSTEARSTETVAARQPVVERPVLPDVTVADPAPLGLAAFALTTFVLSLANASFDTARVRR